MLVKVAVDREKLSNKQRQNYFTNGHWKVPYSHKIDPIWFLLAQFHQRNTMCQPLFFDIEYWRSYRPFLPRNRNFFLLNLYSILFHLFFIVFNSSWSTSTVTSDGGERGGGRIHAVDCSLFFSIIYIIRLRIVIVCVCVCVCVYVCMYIYIYVCGLCLFSFSSTIIWHQR